jgi:hypothetical protein
MSDPSIDAFQDAVILATFGDVDLYALSESALSIALRHGIAPARSVGPYLRLWKPLCATIVSDEPS